MVFPVLVLVAIGLCAGITLGSNLSTVFGTVAGADPEFGKRGGTFLKNS